MQHYAIDPPILLQHTIQGFWYTALEAKELQNGFEILPDGHAEIIFFFGGICSIAVNGVVQPLSSPFMVGLLEQPVILHAPTGLEVIGIKCFPWTVFDLLGLPSGKEPVRMFEHPIALLQSSLGELVAGGRIDVALELLKQYFLDPKMGTPADSMLYKAGIAMNGANGDMPVSEVAAAAHATVRTLERKFRQSSGYTVKDVSALMRFEQVRNQLLCYPNTALAGLAVEVGIET